MTRLNRSRIRYTPGLCGTSCTFFCRSGFSLVETAIALFLRLPLSLALARKIDKYRVVEALAAASACLLVRRLTQTPLQDFADSLTLPGAVAVRTGPS